MKSKLCKMAAIIAASLIGYTANADDYYLYWMLGDTITDATTGATVQYDYAKVSLDGTYLNLFEGATAQGTEIGSAMAGTAYYWGTFQSGNTFLFELYSDTDTQLGTSMLSYEVASLSGFIGNSQTVHGAPYVLTNVPEPTSGLLMLIGMAGLALRRKRA